MTTLGTKLAASLLVAMTASILDMSQRGQAECLLCAADVNTILMGSRRTSLANIANCISEFRRTCQMLKGFPSGLALDKFMASRFLIGDGHPVRVLPTRVISSWDFWTLKTAAVVADTPVKRGLKFVTNIDGVVFIKR